MVRMYGCCHPVCLGSEVDRAVVVQTVSVLRTRVWERWVAVVSR